MNTRTLRAASALALFLSVSMSAMIVVTALLHLHASVARNTAIKFHLAYACGRADQAHVAVDAGTRSACEALQARWEAANR